MLDELQKNKQLKELYKKRCEQVCEKFRFNACSKYEVLDFAYYLDNFASSSEKDIIDAYYNRVGGTANDYLTKLNALQTLPYFGSLNRASVADRIFFYECYKLYGEDFEKISFIKEYYDLEDYELKRYIVDGKAKRRTSKYLGIIEKLLGCDSNEDIISLIEKNKIDTNKLRSELHNILVNNYSDDYDEVYKNLANKIEVYREYKRDSNEKIRQENKILEHNKFIAKNLDSARELVNNFITSNMTISDFCKKMNIDVKDFKKSVSIIQEADNELYEDYSKKIESIQSKNYKTILNEVNKLVDNIKKGVTNNLGQTRDYDAIDFYLDIKVSPKTINDSAKILSSTDYVVLRKFLSENHLLEKNTPFSLKPVLEEKTEINCARDKDGIPIAGTGRVIEESEKLAIVDFLKNNNIPINKRTYNVAFKRYINDDLFSKSNELTKK
ncbi:MAG: hypothetical protein ACI4OT_02180 [Bacilli bacterium]